MLLDGMELISAPQNEVKVWRLIRRRRRDERRRKVGTIVLRGKVRLRDEIVKDFESRGGSLT